MREHDDTENNDNYRDLAHEHNGVGLGHCGEVRRVKADGQPGHSNHRDCPTPRCLGNDSLAAPLARLAAPSLQHFGRHYRHPAGSEGFALT